GGHLLRCCTRAAAGTDIHPLSLHDALPIFYVVADDQRKLIPTFNLASARLILMAQNQGEGEGGGQGGAPAVVEPEVVSNEQLKEDRKSTRLNSSHVKISYAVFCLKKKN